LSFPDPLSRPAFRPALLGGKAGFVEAGCLLGMLPIELFSESSPDPPTPYRILADHSNTMADQLSHYRCHYFLHHPRPITHKLSIFIT